MKTSARIALVAAVFVGKLRRRSEPPAQQALDACSRPLVEAHPAASASAPPPAAEDKPAHPLHQLHQSHPKPHGKAGLHPYRISR